jgi:hypothetical protein
MRHRRVTGKIIAIIAAYAIALQALLAGAALVAHAAAAAQADGICVTNASTNSSGHPIGHQTDCPCGPACTMAACDTLVGLVESIGVAITWVALPGGKLEPILSPLALTDADGRSNLPRAPPIS